MQKRVFLESQIGDGGEGHLLILPLLSTPKSNHTSAQLFSEADTGSKMAVQSALEPTPQAW